MQWHPTHMLASSCTWPGESLHIDIEILCKYYKQEPDLGIDFFPLISVDNKMASMSLCSWRTSCAVCFLTFVLLTNLHLAPSWCLSSLNGSQEIEQLFVWAESGFLEESSHLILLSQWLEIGFICLDFWCALFDVGKKVLAMPSLASFIAALTCFGFSHRLVALPFHSGAVGQETWREFLISNAPFLLICEYAWVSVQNVSVSACVSVYVWACMSEYASVCACVNVCFFACISVDVQLWTCVSKRATVQVWVCLCECM